MNNLKKIRLKNGKTRKEVAEILGITEGQLYKLENGKYLKDFVILPISISKNKSRKGNIISQIHLKIDDTIPELLGFTLRSDRKLSSIFK